MTYREAANRAVNQTLVRSINTSVVALLPVGSILFIGALLLGAGTLLDLSLALFIGIAFGTYSSIFIATPLLVQLREKEPAIMALEQKLTAKRAERAARLVPAVEGGDRSGTLRPGRRGRRRRAQPTYRYDRSAIREHQPSKRVQPRRPPRSRR